MHPAGHLHLHLVICSLGFTIRLSSAALSLAAGRNTLNGDAYCSISIDLLCDVVDRQVAAPP